MKTEMVRELERSNAHTLGYLTLPMQAVLLNEIH